MPWRGVSFMIDSTDALVRTLERRYGMVSAHAVGQAFRASKVGWCVNGSEPRLPRKTQFIRKSFRDEYLEDLVESGELAVATNSKGGDTNVPTQANPITTTMSTGK